MNYSGSGGGVLSGGWGEINGIQSSGSRLSGIRLDLTKRAMGSIIIGINAIILVNFSTGASMFTLNHRKGTNNDGFGTVPTNS